jgi:ABC-type glycerol-3-phosphate transport system substrate-binding protein
MASLSLWLPWLQLLFTATSSDTRPLRVLVERPLPIDVQELWTSQTLAATGLTLEVKNLGDIPSDQIVETVQAYLIAGSVDVVSIDCVYPGLFSELLVPLEQSGFSDNVASRLLPSVYDNYLMDDGQHIGVSRFVDFGLLYYRSDLLLEYGFPEPGAEGWTYDEMEEIAAVVQRGERAKGRMDFDGYIWMGKAYEGLTCFGLEVLAGHAGGTIVDPSGTVTLNNPNFHAALDRMVSWVHGKEGEVGISTPRVLTYDEGSMVARFCKEANAMFARNWPYMIGECNKVGRAGTFGVRRNPGVLPRSGHGSLGGWAFGAARRSPYITEAMRFLELTTGLDWQMQQWQTDGRLPTRSDLAADASLCEVQRTDQPCRVDLTAVTELETLAEGSCSELLLPVGDSSCPASDVDAFATICDVDLGADYIVGRPSTATKENYPGVSRVFFDVLHEGVANMARGSAIVNLAEKAECELFQVLGLWRNLPRHCNTACPAGQSLASSVASMPQCQACRPGSYTSPTLLSSQSKLSVGSNGVAVFHTQEPHFLQSEDLVTFLPTSSHSALSGNSYEVVVVDETAFKILVRSSVDEPTPVSAEAFSDFEVEAVEAIARVFGCTSCEIGRFAKGFGSTTCDLCEEGTATAQVQSSSCVPCEVGTYGDSLGLSSCTPCQGEGASTLALLDGAWVPTVGAKNISSCGCKPNFRSDPFSSDCVACGEGLSCTGMDVYVEPGFSMQSDDAALVYSCQGDHHRCPGGVPGKSCGQDRLGFTCGLCPEGLLLSDGDVLCKRCEGGDFLIFFCVALLSISALGGVTYGAIQRFSTQNQQRKEAGNIMALLVVFLQSLAGINSIGISWNAPLFQILNGVSALELNLKIINLGCMVQLEPVAEFFIKLFIPLISVVVAGVLFAVIRSRRPDDKWITWCLFTNVVGHIALLFFITVVLVTFLPFHCYVHPNGVAASMVTDPEVICWDSPHHSAMISGSVAGIIFYPVGILGGVIFITALYPVAISKPGGVDFLSRYGFIFHRWKPDRYWFSVPFLFRGLAFSCIPRVVPQEQPILSLSLLLLTCLAYLVLQLKSEPWRSKSLNTIDSTLTIATMCTLVIATNPNISVPVSVLLAIGLINVVFWVLIFVSNLGRLTVSGELWSVFLCHHKDGGCCLARFLKLGLQPHFNRPVFYDCDNLSSFTTIFGSVKRSQSMVVLLSGQTCSRPWCVGEITTAHLCGIPMKGVKVKDDGFLDQWSSLKEQELAELSKSFWELAAYGMELSDIRPAIECLLRTEPFRVMNPDRTWRLEELTPEIVTWANEIAQKGEMLQVVGFVSALRVPTVAFIPASVPVVLPKTGRMTLLAVTDDDDIEARAAAHVFQMLLQNISFEKLTLDFKLSSDELVGLKSSDARSLMTIFMVSAGSLNSPVQLAKLSSWRRSTPDHRTLSVITIGSFQFPSKSDLHQLALGEQRLSEADLQSACRKRLISPPVKLVDVARSLQHAFAASVTVSVDMQLASEDTLGLGIRFLAERVSVVRDRILSGSQTTASVVLSESFTDSNIKAQDPATQPPGDNFLNSEKDNFSEFSGLSRC